MSGLWSATVLSVLMVNVENNDIGINGNIPFLVMAVMMLPAELVSYFPVYMSISGDRLYSC